MERLRPALSAYHIDSLQLIAANLGIAPQKPVNKRKLVDDLYEAVQKAAGSTKFIHSLNAAEQEVLAQLVRLERVCTHRDVIIPLVNKGLIYIRGLKATAALPSISEVLESLTRKGLLVNLTPTAPDEGQRQFEPLVNFAIPQEVYYKVKKIIAPAEEVNLSDRYIVETDSYFVRQGHLEETLRNLFFLWSELRRKPARLLKSGAVSKRDQRRIAASMGWEADEDLSQIHLLYAVLKELKLVTVTNNTAEAVDNHAATLFWNTSSLEQVREVFNAYPRIDVKLQFNTKPLSAFSYYSGFRIHSHQEIRDLVVETLIYLAQATWVPYALLFSLTTSGTTGHLVLPPPSLQLFSSAMRWYGMNRKVEIEEQLYEIEQEIVASVLEEIITLGFIDAGFEEANDKLAGAVQVSDLLRTYLRHQSWSVPQEEGQVVLQPDAQLLAMGPVPLRVLANLERVAIREKNDLSVITYRITREGTYQALQRGETLQDLKEYLEDATGQALPQNIARSLEEWAEQYERIVVRKEIRIVQAASPDVLDRLFQDSIVSRYLHRLDDVTAWVKNADSEVLERRLLSLTILPAHSTNREVDLENSLLWDAEQLVARSPLPSLLVIETMQRLAENTAKNSPGYRWTLTEEGVKRALASGLKTIEVIRLLEKMTGSPLSPQLEKRLKSWGQYYGDVYTAQVRLVQLKSKQIMQELRAIDSNLARWMEPLPQFGAVAVVRPENWEETRNLLLSYGVLVREEEWW